MAVSHPPFCCSPGIHGTSRQPRCGYLKTPGADLVLETCNRQFESNFLPLNPKVHVSATQLAWRPLDLPDDSAEVDFVAGLKTLAGNGEPTLREGLAIHIYTANASMKNKAFCNNDGDMLILPQLGRLDIQTEFGQ